MRLTALSKDALWWWFIFKGVKICNSIRRYLTMFCVPSVFRPLGFCCCVIGMFIRFLGAYWHVSMGLTIVFAMLVLFMKKSSIVELVVSSSALWCSLKNNVVAYGMTSPITMQICSRDSGRLASRCLLLNLFWTLLLAASAYHMRVLCVLAFCGYWFFIYTCCLAGQGFKTKSMWVFEGVCAGCCTLRAQMLLWGNVLVVGWCGLVWYVLVAVFHICFLL